MNAIELAIKLTLQGQQALVQGIAQVKDGVAGLGKSAVKADGDSAGFGKTREGLKSISSQLDLVKKGFLAWQAAQAIIATGSDLSRRADEYQNVNSRLKLATKSTQEFADATEAVRAISLKTQSPLASTATLYTRIATVAAEAGASQFQVKSLTEAVSLSLRVSGASAAESASAMLQFSQSVASGVLRGEEFNSVNEAAPRLMKALADSLHVPVGALKAMAENGELTRDKLFGLTTQLTALRTESEQIPPTIGGTLQKLNDAFTTYIGKGAQATGISKGLAAAISLLADNIKVVGDAVVLAGLGAVAFKIGKLAEEGSKLRKITSMPFLFKIGIAIEALQTGIFLGEKLAEKFMTGAAAAGKQYDATSRLLKIHQDFNAAADKLRAAGFDEATIQRVIDMKNAVIGGKIALEDGLLAATNYANGMVSGQTAARDAAVATRDALLKQFGDWEKELDAALKKQGEYAGVVRKLNDELLGIQTGTADRVRELRRRDMDEAGQQADLQAQINEKIKAGQEQLAAGDAKAAEASANEVQRLGERLNSTGDAAKAVEDGGRLLEEVKKKEISAAEEMLAAHQKGLDSLKLSIKEGMDKLVELDAQIRGTATLDVDNRPAIAALDEVLIRHNLLKTQIENNPIVQRVVTVQDSGGITGNGDGTSFSPSTGTIVTPSALGNLFNRGLQRFAAGGAFTNSVVNRPTVFDMGLMGEAGPEAIMPLARDKSGKLGVSLSGAASGSNSITIQNLNLPGISNARQFVDELRQMLRTEPNLLNVGSRVG